MYKGYVIFSVNKKLTPIQFRNQLLIVYLLCVFSFSIDKGSTLFKLSSSLLFWYTHRSLRNWIRNYYTIYSKNIS